MTKLILFIILLFFSSNNTYSQERIYLWPENNMPNLRGIIVEDSVANERLYQVGNPWINTFFTSQQENKGAAVLIIPGGGYARLAYEISGYQLAKWFNSIGMHAFVLAHSLPYSPDLIDPSIAPLQDALQAIKVIRNNAKEWGIDTNRIGVMGSSAGGHLAAMVSNRNEDIEINDDVDETLSFQILISPVIDFGDYTHKGSVNNLIGEDPTSTQKDIYSVYKHVSKFTAPAFIVHAFNDRAVNPMNSVLYYEKLLEYNIPSSLHIFNQGGHSIALRNNPGSTNEWTNLCEEWLIEMDIIPKYK